ncbi:hypothetical protein F5B20DRAFT_464926 [Whalleya microplaca]|nr:hypothetical protein F5B20DRAFT_464926 [Whalleya microplaca]
MAPHLHRKSAKKQTKHEVDYRYRWPTQQTLIESRDLNVYPEGEIERPNSMRIKALEAIAVPLLWMNTKLEDWQDDIDHHVEALEARKQKRPSTSTMSLSAPESPRTRRSLTGSAKPGKSTHPYDTGIGRTETSGGDSEHAVDRTSTPRARGRCQSRSRVKFSSTKRLKSRQKQKTPDKYLADDSCPATIPLLEESEARAEARKKWWQRLSRKTSAQDEQDSYERDVNPAHAEEADVDQEEDLVALIKPREKWRSARDRRASTYPTADVAKARKLTRAKPAQKLYQEELDWSQCRSKRPPKDEVVLLHSKRSAQASARKESVEAATRFAAPRDRGTASENVAKPPNPRHPSRSSPPQAPRTSVSTTPSASVHRPSFARERELLGRRTDSSSPKTPNQLFRLLVHGLRKSPPPEQSRVARPPTPLSRMVRVDSPHTSARSSPDQRNWSWSWVPFWGSPRPLVETPDVSPRGTVGAGVVEEVPRSFSADADASRNAKEKDAKRTWIRWKDTRTA